MKNLLSISFLTLLIFSTIYSCSEEDTSTPEPEPLAPTQYTLTVTAGEGGTVSSEGGTYDEGQSINLIAVPQEGYNFIGWTGDVSHADVNLTLTVNTDLSISAVFEQISQHELQINAGEGGSVSTQGGIYYEGAVINIIATPDEQHIFWQWSDGVIDRDREIVITADTTIQAEFRDKFQIEDGAYKAVGYVSDEGELVIVPTVLPLIFEFENNNVVFSGKLYDDLASFGIYKSVGLIYGESNGDYGLENKYVSRDTLQRTYLTQYGAKQNWGLIKIDEIPNNYTHEEIMELVEGKGFWSDPVYSKIDPLVPESYVIAFIEDAERHGVDLSFVDINKIEVNFREEGFAGASHLSCIDDDRVEISYYKPFWDSASYYDLYNERITVMWHELGHDLLNSNHPVDGNLNQIMNQLLVEPGLPKWDDSDPMFSFRRMVDDMFSGVGLFYTCSNGAKNYSVN